MPEDSQVYKINIISSADNSGFDSADAATKKLKAETDGLNQQMGVIKVSEEEAAEAIASMGKKSEEAGKKVEDAGGKAEGSAGKHMALRRIMGELNRISPGLGEAMHLLAEAYTGAGESAEGGAVGLEAFNVALEEVLVTMGPLVIAMLAIEASFQYWDMYKEKVKAAAEAQAEATKKIVESTHEALKAVQELDEAMHPKKKDTAEADDVALKQQQQNLENVYNRQKALNKANEDKEVGAAGSSEEKEAVQKRFEILDAQLSDWRNKQKAAIEEVMVGTMEKQLASLKTAADALEKKSAPAYQMMIQTDSDADRSRYNAIQEEIKKNADEAKAIREKLDDLTGQQSTDAGNSAFESETNRERFRVGGQNYDQPINPANDNAANKFATGKSIADLVAGGGNASDAQAQFLVLLEQSITGQHLTFTQAVTAMEAQAKNTDFAATLIQNVHTRIDAVTARLQQLEQQMKHGATLQ